jgi:methylated-DNA-[protein]-cysteine S-methyltransferase
MARLVLATSLTAPWGPIRLAASARGIVALDQLVTAGAFAERLERRFGVAPTSLGSFEDRDEHEAASETRGRLEAATTSVAAFLVGDLDALDSVGIDLEDRPAWDRLVLGAVREVRPGTTVSYGEVARMIGRPGAARAVGAAVGRNPIGLVIPCHRVIAGDGSLGGYGGGWWGGRAAGLELKRSLLQREGVDIRAGAPED